MSIFAAEVGRAGGEGESDGAAFLFAGNAVRDFNREGREGFAKDAKKILERGGHEGAAEGTGWSLQDAGDLRRVLERSGLVEEVAS